MTSPVRARLLIVDDEAGRMQALCSTLTREGYFTRGFRSGKGALSSLRRGEFDLMITELQMPELDGVSLINEAQAIDPELTAIVMIGQETFDTAVRAMQSGAVDYIFEPYELNTILPVVARALEIRTLRRENSKLQAEAVHHAEKLVAAYQDLESFTFSISHDLRAPLRTISGFAQALEEDFMHCLGVEGQRFLRIIRDGAGKMDELILGLLELSRISRAALDQDFIDMTGLAKTAAVEATAQYPRPIPLIEIAELPQVVGDRPMMHLVWSNLIGNALKYSSGRAEPKVEVSCRLEAGEAIFTVQDNGAGFDMRYADKLFGVFQRLHANDEFSGIGVGLAIVHRIIVRHGGRIRAQGQPDAGARFEFALPTPKST
jgi:hypothetical protein